MHGAPDPGGPDDEVVVRLLGAGSPRLAVVCGLIVLLAVLPGSAAVPSRSPQGTGQDCLAVGAGTGTPQPGGRSPSALFASADRAMGPLTMRRSFDSSLPARFATSAAATDPAAGLRSFVSWKPPRDDHRGAAAGRYDPQIAAWARSVPRTGVFATAFHEPENDMTAEDFVAFQRHVYSVVKAANPTIRWGPVYMDHWWDPAQSDHYVGDPAAWWPGDDHADFVGFDWYGATPQPMTQSPSFRHWYATMAPPGLPLVIAEYGQYVQKPGVPPDPELEQARAEAIRQDAAWIAGHPQVVAWLYWQGHGPRGDWRMQDEASLAAWREVAADGCSPRPSAHR